jgi:hypothetical protein
MPTMTRLPLVALLASALAGPVLAAGFAGNADPANFTVATMGTLLGDPANSGGAQFTATELLLTGGSSAGGCDGGTYAVAGPCELGVHLASAGTYQFHWSYSTTDVDGPAGDMFGMLIDGQRTAISDPGGAVAQSGDVVIGASQSFGWTLNCTDCTGGTASVTISNFSLTPVPEPAGWALLLAGGAGLAALRRRRAKPRP